jgi:hypothetical protein
VDAVALNPAALGLSGNPRAAWTVAGASVEAGLSPVSLADMADYRSTAAPAEVREAWLQAIEAEGAQEGRVGGDLALFALSIGPVALQLTTSRSAATYLDGPASELLLFGNSGRTGEVRELEPVGASLDAFAWSTVAVAYGFRIPVDPRLLRPGERLSVGIGGSFTVGHDVLMIRDAGSRSVPGSTDVALPALESSSAAGFLDGGQGFGVDVGLAWESGPLVVSAAGRNVVNTFQWDTAGVAYRPNRILLDGSSGEARFDEDAVARAPDALVALLEEQAFQPEIVAGMGYRIREDLTVAVDGRTRFGEVDIRGTPDLLVGASAEMGVGWSVVRTVRYGAAYVTGGFQAGGGVGLGLGPLNLQAGALYRSADGIASTRASLALALGGG